MTANAPAAAPGGVADGRPRRGARTEGRPAVRSRLVAHLHRIGQRRRLQVIGSGGAPIYQAAAALPHPDRGRASEALRDQLAIMALAAGLTPDWSTFAVTGPTEMTGTQQEARFEWTGRVTMRGSSPLVTLPDPDAFPQHPFPQHPAANGDTVPFRVEGSWNRPRRAELSGTTPPPEWRSPSENTTRAAAQRASAAASRPHPRTEGITPMAGEQLLTREQLRTRLAGELAELERIERPRLLAVLGTTDGRDVADRADRVAREQDLARLDARIARLQTRLVALDIETAAHPLQETTVVVDFGDGPETFLVDEFCGGGVPVVTPMSPLGQALVGAASGQTLTYRTPRGTARVVLVAVHGVAARAA